MGRYVAVPLLALIVLIISCFGQPQKAPHFKYSEEANTKHFVHEHDHGHAHDQDHNHGHAHDNDHDHGHAHDQDHNHYSGHAHDHTDSGYDHAHEGVRGNIIPISAKQIWTDTIGSVTLISVAPFILLMLVPDLNKHRNLLKILLGFAAGGLLGDAFLHLIPHAHSHSHSQGHEHHAESGHSHSINSPEITVPLWVIGGIFCFLCIDKFLRFLKPGVDGHGHSHDIPKPINHANADVPANEGKKKNKKQNKNGVIKPSAQGDNNKQNFNAQKKKKNESGMQTAGYLNLAADFTHNFTDGIAIAGSFMLGRNVGYVTTLTVLIHELPHEIGDYAILIKSGCGIYKAMFLQLITAFGALLGAASSLLVSGVGIDPTAYGFPVGAVLSSEIIATRLLPLTAGGFIYIALVSVIPDLLADRQDSHQVPASISKRIGQTLAELSALIMGVVLMIAITLFE